MPPTLVPHWRKTEGRRKEDRGQAASTKDPPFTGIPFTTLAELFDRSRRILEEKALFPNVSRRVPEQMGSFPERVPVNTARNGVLFPKNSRRMTEEIREKCKGRVSRSLDFSWSCLPSVLELSYICIRGVWQLCRRYVVWDMRCEEWWISEKRISDLTERIYLHKASAYSYVKNRWCNSWYCN